MYITAIGLPALLPQWEGSVHSVFRNSCNIRVKDGRLLTVHRFDFGMLPCSLFVPNLSTGQWRPGDPVRGDSCGILLGEERIGWAERVEEVDTSIPGPKALPTSLDGAWRLLREKQRSADSLPMVEETYCRLRREIDLLWKGLICNDKECIRTQCQACIGLGQGLTPTGDDMLLGTLAALHMYQPELARRLGEGMLPLLDRTNDISRSYLEFAIHGYAATPVIRATEHLSGDTGALETLLSVGHSSGGDILEGILIATQYLQEKRERK